MFVTTRWSLPTLQHPPFRPLLVALALAVVACRDAATDAVAPRVPRPSFTMDFTAPETPSNVSVSVVSGLSAAAVGAGQAAVRVSWMDNSGYLDEYATCARVTQLDNTPVTTVCTWASTYDLPAGSTGQRSSDLAVPAGGPYLMRLSVARWITQDDGWHRSIYSAESEPVTVEALVVSTSPGKKKGRS